MLLQDRRSQKEMTQNKMGNDTHGQQKARKERETYGDTMEMKIQWIPGHPAELSDSVKLLPTGARGYVYEIDPALKNIC